MGWTEKVALCGLLLSCFVTASDGTGVLKVGTTRCITETKTNNEYTLERGFLFLDESEIKTEISEPTTAKPFLVALPGSTSWDSVSKKYPAHRLPATNAYNGVVWIGKSCTPKGHSVVCGDGPSKKSYNFSFGTDCKKEKSGAAVTLPRAPWVMLAGTSHDGPERDKEYDVSVVSVGGFFSDADLYAAGSTLEKVAVSESHDDTLWFTDGDVRNINALEELMVNLSQEIENIAGVSWEDSHPQLQRWVTGLEETWNKFGEDFKAGRGNENVVGVVLPQVPVVTLTHLPSHTVPNYDAAPPPGSQASAGGAENGRGGVSRPSDAAEAGPEPGSILAILGVERLPTPRDPPDARADGVLEKLRENKGHLADKAGTLLGAFGDQTKGFWIYCVHNKLDKSESALCDGRVAATSPGPGAPLYSLTKPEADGRKPAKGTPAQQLMFSIRSSASFAAKADENVMKAKKETSSALDAALAAVNGANAALAAVNGANAALAAANAAKAAEVAESSVTRLLSRRDLPLLMSRKVTCTLHPPTDLKNPDNMEPTDKQRTLTRWEMIKESVKKPFRKHVMTPLSRGPSTLAANVKKWNDTRKDAAKEKKVEKRQKKAAKKQQENEKYSAAMKNLYQADMSE